jgi:hypothetical protein
MTQTAATFVEKYLHGQATISEMEEYVDAWHQSPDDGRSLAEFLGLTQAEYALWVEKPSALESLLNHRKHTISIG